MSRPVKQIEVCEEIIKLLGLGYKSGKTHIYIYRKRCQIVPLKLEGYKSKETGKIVGSCEMSVNNWINRFEAEGLSGLQTRSGRGRKPILEASKRMSAATLTRFLKLITAVTNE